MKFQLETDTNEISITKFLNGEEDLHLMSDLDEEEFEYEHHEHEMNDLLDNDTLDNQAKKKKKAKNGKKKKGGKDHSGDYDPHEVVVHFQNELLPASHYLQ